MYNITKIKIDIEKQMDYAEFKLMINNNDCDICFDNKQDAFKLTFDNHKCNINICVGCLEKIRKELLFDSYDMFYACPLCRKNILFSDFFVNYLCYNKIKCLEQEGFKFDGLGSINIPGKENNMYFSRILCDDNKNYSREVAFITFEKY